MRRKRKTMSVVEKNRQISKSLSIYWISSVLFGIATLLYLPAAVTFFPSLETVIDLFLLINFVLSVRGVLELRKFRAKFTERPDEYINKHVRPPLLYRAFFWYLPK